MLWLSHHWCHFGLSLPWLINSAEIRPNKQDFPMLAQATAQIKHTQAGIYCKSHIDCRADSSGSDFGARRNLQKPLPRLSLAQLDEDVRCDEPRRLLRGWLHRHVQP